VWQGRWSGSPGGRQARATLRPGFPAGQVQRQVWGPEDQGYWQARGSGWVWGLAGQVSAGQFVPHARCSSWPGGQLGQGFRQARRSGRPGGTAGLLVPQARWSGRTGCLAGHRNCLAKGSGWPGGLAGQGVWQAWVSGMPRGLSGQGVC
jgi:hypothetical protein